MTEINKKFFKEWLKKAQDDELSASVLIKEGGSPNTICFLSQQMAEKYLKAFLVFYDKDFPKIHQLDTLLELCAKTDSSLLALKEEVVFLSDFYIVARYPGDYSSFSLENAKQAFKMASKIRDFILGKVFKV